MDYLSLKTGQKLEVLAGDLRFILKVPSALDYLYATAYTTYSNRLRLVMQQGAAARDIDDIALARTRELCKLCIVEPKDFDPWGLNAVVWQQFLRNKVEILCGQQTVEIPQADPFQLLAMPPGRYIEQRVGPVLIKARVPSALDGERLRAAWPDLENDLTVEQLKESWRLYTERLFAVTDVKMDWMTWSAPLLAHVTLFLMSVTGQRISPFRHEYGVKVIEEVSDMGPGSSGIPKPGHEQDQPSGGESISLVSGTNPQTKKSKLGKIPNETSEA